MGGPGQKSAWICQCVAFLKLHLRIYPVFSTPFEALTLQRCQGSGAPSHAHARRRRSSAKMKRMMDGTLADLKSPVSQGESHKMLPAAATALTRFNPHIFHLPPNYDLHAAGRRHLQLPPSLQAPRARAGCSCKQTPDTLETATATPKDGQGTLLVAPVHSRNKGISCREVGIVPARVLEDGQTSSESRPAIAWPPGTWYQVQPRG